MAARDSSDGWLSRVCRPSASRGHQQPQLLPSGNYKAHGFSVSSIYYWALDGWRWVDGEDFWSASNRPRARLFTTSRTKRAAKPRGARAASPDQEVGALLLPAVLSVVHGCHMAVGVTCYALGVEYQSIKGEKASNVSHGSLRQGLCTRAPFCK